MYADAETLFVKGRLASIEQQLATTGINRLADNYGIERGKFMVALARNGLSRLMPKLDAIRPYHDWVVGLVQEGVRIRDIARKLEVSEVYLRRYYHAFIEPVEASICDTVINVTELKECVSAIKKPTLVRCQSRKFVMMPLSDYLELKKTA